MQFLDIQCCKCKFNTICTVSIQYVVSKMVSLLYCSSISLQNLKVTTQIKDMVICDNWGEGSGLDIWDDDCYSKDAGMYQKC